MLSQKVTQAVTPAYAGVQKFLVFLDSGFRRNDRKGLFLTFCETINKWLGPTQLLNSSSGDER